MKLPQSCVLVLEQQPDDLLLLKTLLEGLRCPMLVAASPDQVMDRACQSHPCLVILSGNYQDWSPTLIHQLRSIKNLDRVTIVALTDPNSPRWLRHEEHPGLDGFLVKPLNLEVVMSLVQSAWARQTCTCPC